MAESEIEGGEPSDQVGCVRRFTLRDGNHIREQLLALSDRDHVSTYCILDATLPLRRYVATRPAQAGDRRRPHVLALAVHLRRAARAASASSPTWSARGVYEGGFEGLRAYLRRVAPRAGSPARRPRARSRRGASMPAQGVVVTRLRRPRGAALPAAARAPPPGPGEVRIRQTAIGVNYIDVYVRAGLYRMIEPPAPLGMEAAGVVVDVGDGVAHLLPGDRVAYACPPPGAYASARTLRGRPGRRAARRRRRRDAPPR